MQQKAANQDVFALPTYYIVAVIFITQDLYHWIKLGDPSSIKWFPTNPPDSIISATYLILFANLVDDPIPSDRSSINDFPGRDEGFWIRKDNSSQRGRFVNAQLILRLDIRTLACIQLKEEDVLGGYRSVVRPRYLIIVEAIPDLITPSGVSNLTYAHRLCSSSSHCPWRIIVIQLSLLTSTSVNNGYEAIEN